MPMRGWNPKPENFIVLQCKTCGAFVKVLPAQRRTMKIRCHACKGTRFHAVDLSEVTE